MGVRSLILSLAIANGFALAALLLTHRRNRRANALLAALIAAFTLRLAPHALGFAGLYDEHRWLTFLPFDLSLLFGPLLWAYIMALTGAQVSQKSILAALAPGALQFAYQVMAFALPLNAKWDWYAGPHLHVVAPAGAVLALGSATAYLWAACRRLAVWRRHDPAATAAASWLGVALGLFTAVLAVSTAAAAFSLTVRPLSYRERFPLMLALAALAHALGLLGWRFGDRAYPATPSRARLAAARADYAALADRWAQRVRIGGWAAEGNLTAAQLASRLGVSPRTLSRGLADGRATTVTQFLNALRIETVLAALAAGDKRDVLTLALEAGFNSKASFNRAFTLHAGCTPSALRSALKDRQKRTLAEGEAHAAAS